MPSINSFNFKNRATISSLAAALLATACGGGTGEQPAATQSAQATAYEAPIEGAFTNSPVSARAIADKKTADFAPDRVIVRFQDAATISNQKSLNAVSSLRRLGFSVIKEINFAADTKNTKSNNATSAAAEPAPHLAVLSLNGSGMSVAQAIERLQSSGVVRYAEPDYRMKLHQVKSQAATSTGAQQTLAVPTDSLYNLQWHHNNTGLVGATSVGIAGKDLDTPLAWNLTTGSSTDAAPVIAVIDCGFKLNHVDLVGNWWTNPAPTFGDVNGADFGENDGDPSSTSCTHGTQVSGVIGAKGNNAAGMTGIMWNTRIMALKTANAAGALYVSSEIAAINYIVNQKNAGVNIKAINISLGGDIYSQAEFDAVKAAGNAGLLVVASAGNNGMSDRNYPAAYELPNIISVGSTDRSDTLSTFSNYGSWVDIGAPGEEIVTTSFATSTLADIYTYADGTSFSAPVVAGIAGLIANYVPSATMQQIRQRIISSAEYAPGLNNLMRVAGRVNAYRALTNEGTYIFPTTWITDNRALGDQYIKNASYLANAFIGVGPNTIGVVSTINGVDYNMRDDGKYPDKFAGDGHYTAIVKPNAIGTAVPISFKHLYSSGATTATSISSGTIAVGDAGNYQVQTSSALWSEPSTAPDVQALYTAPGDEGSVAVNLPFSVAYYGVSNISNIKVTPNGFVCVGDGNCSVLPTSTYETQPIPSNGARPHGILAPWWHDWVVSGNVTSNIFTHTEGVAPNRKFVVTWKNAFAYADNLKTDGVSFQVQLYEGQNKFSFAYNDVTTNMAVSATGRPDGGLLGSAGIQFFNGKIGTRTSYNTFGSIVAGTSKDLVLANSFSDVAPSDAFLPFIESLRGSGVTNGCATSLYCPNDAVFRNQMAAFIIRATHGYDLVAYPALSNPVTPSFVDVSTTNSFYKYIETMKLDGITSGCGAAAYCPDSVVLREQMAVFLVRAVRGSAYLPPAAIGQFADVVTSGFYTPYIEELARMGVTNGCGAGNFCPSNPVTRREMATFLQRAFRPYDFQ